MTLERKLLELAWPYQERLVLMRFIAVRLWAAGRKRITGRASFFLLAIIRPHRRRKDRWVGRVLLFTARLASRLHFHPASPVSWPWALAPPRGTLRPLPRGWQQPAVGVMEGDEEEEQKKEVKGG
jgi:hypothetical protein